MNAPPVTLALIGAGGIAGSYLAALANNPLVELVAVVDPRASAAEAAATPHGATWHASTAALLEQQPGVSAAIVCTPPSTHEAIAVELMRAGVHVLCEKPFSITAESARRMASTARATGVVLTMGSKFRYVQDVIEARARVLRGEIGEVVLFENAFTGRVDMSQRWNAVPAISGGGVLIDNGTHSVDILRYFLGPLAEVNAVEGKRIQNLPVEDTARLFVRSQTGVMGSVDLSWSLNKELDWYIQVFGSTGTVQVGWKQSRIKQGTGAWQTFGSGYDKVQAFRGQLQNFARAIRNEEPLRITWEDAVASVDVVEAAYESMNHSRWTGVRSSCPLTSTPRPIGETATHREVVRA